MTAEEFANKLGITKKGEYVDGVYVISLDNSNEYSKMYTILDKSELCDLDTEEVNLGVTDSIMVYLSDDFDIKLKANFDTDTYTVSFEEIK